MSNQDIREWARRNGRDIGDRGRLPAALVSDYEDAMNEPVMDEDGPVMVAVPTGPAPVPEAVTAPVAAPESAPQAPPRPPRGKFADRLAGKPKPPGSKQVVPLRARMSLENVIGSGWALAAQALMRSDKAIPMCRVMQVQAPVVGVVADDLLKGTAVDRLLQPLARAGEKGEKAFAVLGPPLIVAAMTNQPQLYEPLRPMLKMALMSWAEISEPAMRKAEKRAQAFAERTGMSDVDLDGMIANFFAPVWPGQPGPSPEEEAAIRRAQGEQS